MFVTPIPALLVVLCAYSALACAETNTASAVAVPGDNATAPLADAPFAENRSVSHCDPYHGLSCELVRGITIGPIENSMHPNVGYGSPAYARTLLESRAWGANWVAITPFGRTMDLKPTGVDLTFESPFEKNREDIVSAIHMAHRSGLRVFLVPHIWVESGEWRAEIDPGSPEAWDTWADNYETFIITWARVAEETKADLLSVGVELRSWVTTFHAPRFVDLIHRVREVFHGPITYSANWDDVMDTVILGELDVIGINAFFPLTDHENASFEVLLDGGYRVSDQVRELAHTWNRPVLFTEVGYTTRKDPALRPWEWPDSLQNVVIDETAQALAYKALLLPLIDEPDFAGFFVWRVYADPDDVSQESEWGFSPRGKHAELIVRDAFSSHWARDGAYTVGSALKQSRALRPGLP